MIFYLLGWDYDYLDLPYADFEIYPPDLDHSGRRTADAGTRASGRSLAGMLETQREHRMKVVSAEGIEPSTY